MKIGIVLQARTGSSRLPGKVLRSLGGRTMLERAIARLDRISGVECRVVATTDLVADDPIEEVARKLGWHVLRGSENDVLDRYRTCAVLYGLDAVVRATADNPFVDAEEGSRLVRLYREAPVDHACMFPSLGGTLPVGVGLEIIASSALEAAWRESDRSDFREHVNDFVLANEERFSLRVFTSEPRKSAPALRLTVDTSQDLARAETIIERFRRDRLGDDPPTAWIIENAGELE